MIVGNIIDVYPFGMIVVLIHGLLYVWSFGLVLCSFPLYPFLTRIEIFVVLPFMLELLNATLLSIDSYTIAYNTVVYIVIDVNVGFIIRLLHVLGATFFMFLIFIHWIRGPWIKIDAKIIVGINADWPLKTKKKLFYALFLSF